MQVCCVQEHDTTGKMFTILQFTICILRYVSFVGLASNPITFPEISDKFPLIILQNKFPSRSAREIWKFGKIMREIYPKYSS